MDPYSFNPNPSYSSYPYYPPPHHPQAPTPPLTHHDVISQPPNPSLHPPGVEPYSYTHSQPAVVYEYHHQNVGYYSDPNASQAWAVKDAIRQYGAPPPAGYSTALDSLNTSSLYSVDPNNLSSHPLPNDYHAIASTSNGIRRIKTQGAVRSSQLGVSVDLETKKRKLLECGTTSESVMVCSACNVVCNSQTVFNYHLAGKKHAAQVGMISQNGVVKANPVPSYRTNSVAQPPSKNAKGKGLKKAKIVQSAWCEICSIDCNSQDVLLKHRMGKKHLKNLEKLKEPNKSAITATNNQATNNPVIGPPEKPQSNNGNAGSATKAKKKSTDADEDVETKKQKIVKEGAAAEEVRVCELCNVVCNSPTVFSFHLAGQKHKALVKKHAADGASAPQAITVS